jgi:uncharacterized lipoprotein YddW (UPF0748 family)
MRIGRKWAAAQGVLILSLGAFAQQLSEVPREFRAVWVATVANIDFPTKKALRVAEQKKELDDILDLCEELKLNAVVFQVRPMSDAVYASKLEPWSEFLTGEMGKPQGFDPLAYLVAQAHGRGILVHAWFNPYRAYHTAAKTMSSDHVSKKQPGVVRQYGRYMWLDPTDDAAKRQSLAVIKDVVRRYDIDGVHFDDYFYPYAETDAAGKKIEFPDEANWQRYLQTAKASPVERSDWRRSHVNDFISSVGREIKRIKPQIVYGISPFGIWQPLPDKGITGFNAYAELYADARKWLQDGTVDYLAPQLYWETARQGQSFPVLLNWWKSQNTKGRHIWPGIAAYRIGSTATFDTSEIARQIDLTRGSTDTRGAIYFSQKSLRNDMGGIRAKLAAEIYRTAAVVPRFPWIKAQRMRSPAVKIVRSRDLVRAAWNERGGGKAFWFIVYVKDKDGWSHSVLPARTRSISLSAERQIQQIVVHSVDRLGNESR